MLRLVLLQELPAHMNLAVSSPVKNESEREVDKNMIKMLKEQNKMLTQVRNLMHSCPCVLHHFFVFFLILGGSLSISFVHLRSIS